MHRTLLAVILASAALNAQSQDNLRARQLASACAICHGTDGQAVTQEVVSLAGRSRDDIALQMRAFRDGQRPATVMHQVAKGYTDEQIDALAAYFSMQKKGTP